MNGNRDLNNDNKNNDHVDIIVNNNNPLDDIADNNDAPLPPKPKKKEFTIFPIWLAIIVLIINIVLPGIGTFIATAKVTDRTYISFYCFSGLCQFLTFICIIGWVFALIHSITFISAACAHKSIEEYLASTKAKTNPIAKMNKKEKNLEQQPQL